jgi:hypothetical protein
MSIELNPQQKQRQKEYERMIRASSREQRKSEKRARGKRNEHETDEL